VNPRVNPFNPSTRSGPGWVRIFLAHKKVDEIELVH